MTCNKEKEGEETKEHHNIYYADGTGTGLDILHTLIFRTSMHGCYYNTHVVNIHVTHIQAEVQ